MMVMALHLFKFYDILITHALLAQLVEQLTLNQWVAGSNPAGGTTSIKKSHAIAWLFILNR